MKRQRNPEKPDFCEAKSQPKNKNSKLDICPSNIRIKKTSQTRFFLTPLEIVDIFKNYDNIIIMKFTVEKLPQAKAEIDSLEQSQKDMLEADYKKIQEQGIEFVRVKPIQKEIFEIKTNELRSLFKYAAGRIIVVGVVFVKKTKKTPKEKIKLAKQRLKEV